MGEAKCVEAETWGRATGQRGSLEIAMAAISAQMSIVWLFAECSGREETRTLKSLSSSDSGSSCLDRFMPWNVDMAMGMQQAMSEW
jgi:hypothetical protein